VRDGRLGGVPDAGQVDVDHVAPGLLVHDVQAGAVAAEARVGADDVQSTQLLNTTVDGGLDGVVVADVDLGGHDATIQLLDQIRSLREVI